MGQQAGAGNAKAARQVTITFRPEVGVQTIHSTVENLVRTLKPGGCSHCGLVGIDLTLRAGDPELSGGLKELLHHDDVIGVDVQF
ncbi:hypothetical protein [Streptomyces sp. NRRL WC-3742]|uniref:hypothetical protein n=1 Tax=Streptomyces sp. NRRL WC-3742 TaxID=1463934 RepID=UPI0004C5922C|nr:hypothetical protein [Streptomyces sp. NRRL WC-3742]